ncbi:Autoinducer 2 (AI-2) kinase LsrK [Klebsiella variicola]|uniref:Autoinducer 2 (AI-2) kinase LsrK n=1 Tax=Klebsiella variicola TaxID=244366 RepID=A0A7H4M7Y8_KLEVA|nr:Autoinducer 2 (AI-2) kinase LsrK [Klebsiella variicola]
MSWHAEFTPNPQHRELYQEMMSKWQTVYADQLGLVDSGADNVDVAGTGPGAPPARSVFPVTLTTGTDPPFPLSLWERAGG